MILTKEIEVRLNQFNSHHYKRIGYDVDGKESIDIKIEDVGKGSSVKVEVECDVCGNIKTLTYRKYLKNIKSHNFYSCSNKCSVIKSEMTCLERYGVKYPLQSEKIMSDLKDYFIEKFGFDNPSKSKDVQEKRDNTMMKKYGVKTNIILPETHNKAVMLSKTDESKEKRENTLLERYGVNNAMKSEKIYQKFKDTNIKKYGVEYPAQNIDIFEKTNKSGLKIKYFDGISYQGTYELDLLKKLKDMNILHLVSKPNSIKYLYKENYHHYFPDFYIEKFNLIIEVKSDYYFNLSLEKNIKKEEFCKKLNYNFIFIINKDYNDLIDFIEKQNLTE